MKRWVWYLVALGVLALALQPVFFAIDRIMVFNTVPRDDYAPFLLWVIGAPGGAFPGSPYGYRLLTILAAVPLYHILPALHFTNLPPTLTPQYVQATAAIAALSYLSILAAGLMIYRVARDRIGLPRREATIAGALLGVLVLYSDFFGIDTFAIFLVTAGIYLLPWPLGFSMVIVPAVFANEKVAIVFALWLTLRYACSANDRREYWRQWLAAIAAIVAYGLALLIVHLHGNEYQLKPSGYLTTLINNLHASISGRGLLLNAWPVALLFVVGAFGWWCGGRPLAGTLFRPIDLLVIPGLVVVALVLTQLFQTGRIVVHSAPLFVVPAAVSVGRWMDAASSMKQL